MGKIDYFFGTLIIAAFVVIGGVIGQAGAPCSKLVKDYAQPGSACAVVKK